MEYDNPTINPPIPNTNGFGFILSKVNIAFIKQTIEVITPIKCGSEALIDTKNKITGAIKGTNIVRNPFIRSDLW